MDRVFIGPFDIDHVHQPIFVGKDGWKSQNDGPGNRHFIFFFSPHLALHTKCRICLAWLIIKHLLCRLHQSVAMYCRWPFLGRYPSQCGVHEERVECIILLLLLNLLCRPSSQVVADFGCGEALIAQSITNKVYSFDLIAKNKFVTACNMAKVGFQFYFFLGKGYLRNFGTCSYMTVHPFVGPPIRLHHKASDVKSHTF